jgi:hypothetical protein
MKKAFLALALLLILAGVYAKIYTECPPAVITESVELHANNCYEKGYSISSDLEKPIVFDCFNNAIKYIDLGQSNQKVEVKLPRVVVGANRLFWAKDTFKQPAKCNSY